MEPYIEYFFLEKIMKISYVFVRFDREVASIETASTVQTNKCIFPDQIVTYTRFKGSNRFLINLLQSFYYLIYLLKHSLLHPHAKKVEIIFQDNGAGKISSVRSEMLVKFH